MVRTEPIPDHLGWRRFKFTLSKNAVKRNNCLRLGLDGKEMGGKLD